MLHFLTIGHLEVSAVRECRVGTPTQLLPAATVAELMNRFRDPGVRATTFEGTNVDVYDGWVRCTWYAPRLIVTSVQFALALQGATGCLIADVEHGRIVLPDDLHGTKNSS